MATGFIHTIPQSVPQIKIYSCRARLWGLFPPSQTARTVSDRNRTQRAVSSRAYKPSCFPSHYGPPPSFVTASYVLSRFVAFTPFYYGLLRFSSAPWLPWQIFWQFKNLARHPRQSRPVTVPHGSPSRLPALSHVTSPHVHPVLSMVAWNVTAVAAGNIV